MHQIQLGEQLEYNFINKNLDLCKLDYLSGHCIRNSSLQTRKLPNSAGFMQLFYYFHILEEGGEGGGAVVLFRFSPELFEVN